jgi:signal transduction histidine kinase
MVERRRLERDLHDGAQQRLVARSLQLGLARRKVEDGPAAGARLWTRRARRSTLGSRSCASSGAVSIPPS